MSKKNQLIIGVILVFGIAATVMLVVNSNKKVSNKSVVTVVNKIDSSFAKGSISVVSSNLAGIKKGSEMVVRLVVDGSDKKVNGVQTMICYGPELDVSDTAKMVLAGENNEIILVKKTQLGGKNCLDLAVGAKVSAKLRSGVTDMAMITFETKSVGSGQIEIMPEKTVVSGENPGSINNQIKMTGINNLSYSVIK